MKEVEKNDVRVSCEQSASQRSAPAQRFNWWRLRNHVFNYNEVATHSKFTPKT